MLSYYQLGAGKRLSEIVIAGSHDAGITAGSKVVKTQNYNIFIQAMSGVRLFDLRVTGARGGGGQSTLKTYHGQGPKAQHSNQQLNQQTFGQGGRNVESKKMWLGEYGQSLVDILTQANDFVNANQDEFLILKFDKCDNWSLIAEACIAIVKKSNGASNLYEASEGNVNTKTLAELRGKVIVCFSQKGHATLTSPTHKSDITKFKGLYNSENPDESASYDPGYWGLQYWGKGGTSLSAKKNFGSRGTYKGKIKQNIKKQSSIMDARFNQANGADPNVLGMMYWTTTGMTQSIKKRNQKMWSKKHSWDMFELWMGGVEATVKQLVANGVNPMADPSGAIIKRFLPNIVMIDFADTNKCQIIYNLNLLGGQDLLLMMGDD